MHPFVTTSISMRYFTNTSSWRNGQRHAINVWGRPNAEAARRGFYKADAQDH